MKTYTADEIKEVVEKHRKWARSEDGGSRADLTGAYLSGAYLSGAYLSGAYLSGAYLSGAYLRGADMSGAYLRGEYEGKRLRVNWQSHALLSEILRHATGDDIEKRKVAGLIAISTDWCWRKFGALTTDPLFDWAMDEMATWVTDEDGAPEVVRLRVKPVDGAVEVTP